VRKVLVLLLALGLVLPVAAHAARPTASPDERYALVVGVTQYAGRTADTAAGAKDALSIVHVLVQNGWRRDRIRLLTDGAATGRAIADGLAWLQRSSSDRTFSLFHYSGHVKRSGGAQHLWGSDNTYLRDTDVAAVLRGVRGTAWTDIAGCHAGGFDEGLSSERHLFTSSRVTEKSYEQPLWGNSVWTDLLWEQGLGQRKGDADRDGGVSVQEAVQWAAPKAAAYTAGQRPYGPQHPVRAGGLPLRLDAPRTLR
jgi:hypothetical protein